MVVVSKVISRNVARSQVTSKDNSNRQNQFPSTGPGKMNIASTLPQTEADFFDEKGLPKQYIPQNQHTGSMYVLKKFQGKPNDILFSDNGVEIQHSVSDPDPTPIPTPDFPFQEFPLTEVVRQSQIDISSISDTSDPRETCNSSSKATKSTVLPLQSGLANRSHEEMRETEISPYQISIHNLREILILFLFQIILLQGNPIQGSLQGSLQGS